MANVDHNKFIINSDFPMPAQVSQVSATVNIPAGSSAGGASHAEIYTADVNVGEGAQILRMAIKSSRNNIVAPGGTLTQYFNDGTFVAFFQNLGNNTVRCTVQVTAGFEAPMTISSDNNFTFYISSFRLP